MSVHARRLKIHYNGSRLRFGSRRQFLQALGGGAALLPMARYARATSTPAAAISDRLVEEIQKGACRYFFEMADPNTGLVRDRASVDEPYAPSAASIAATGFGLSALAIGVRRGFLDRNAAENRVRTT